jgi:hypothetical protein
MKMSSPAFLLRSIMVVYALGLVFQVVASGIALSNPRLPEERGIPAANVTVFILGSLAFTVLVVVGMVLWARAAQRRLERGATEWRRIARPLAIVVIVLSALGLLTEGPALAQVSFADTPHAVLSLVGIFTVLVSVVTLGVAIMLLRTTKASASTLAPSTPPDAR